MHRKSILFISSKAPWSSAAPLACLDACMTSAVFDVPTTLVLLGDGVQQLLPGQDAGDMDRKDVSRMFGALGLYGIDTVYVDAAALAALGISLDELQVEGESQAPLRLQTLHREELSVLLEQSAAVFNF